MYLSPEDLSSPQPKTQAKGQAQGPDWPEFFRQCSQQSSAKILQNFYRQPLPAASTPIGQCPLVALDIETTGLNPLQHGIVSIGLLPFNMQGIPLAGAKYWLLNPIRELKPETVVVHGITHADIAQAPRLAEIAAELLAELAGKIVVVHYQRIEREFLRTAFQQQLGSPLVFPCLDTLALEAQFVRKGWRFHWQQLLGQAPTSIRLADCRRRYGLPNYPPHHALTDALATAELLQAQIQHRYSAQTPIGDLWQ